MYCQLVCTKISAAFLVDWETTHARCPRGQTSATWTPGREGSSAPGPPRLFFHQHCKPVGAGAGDRRARPFFPGHFIPAPFFNEGAALVGTDFLEGLQLLLVVRVLHKLGNADRRPRRQDCLVAQPCGGARGGPPPQAKPMIMAMMPPQIRPHTPYFTFAAVTGVMDHPSYDSTMAGRSPAAMISRHSTSPTSPIALPP